MLENWRAKRAAKKEARMNPYDKEEIRLREMIAKLDPLDENYDRLQGKLKTTINMRADSKESKRRICKSDRGGIIMRIVGVAGAIGGMFLVSKYEADGNTWTGEKRSFMDGVVKTLGNWFRG